MTSAQVVETSVNVTTKSPSQDYAHPDNHTPLTYDYDSRVSKHLQLYLKNVRTYVQTDRQTDRQTARHTYIIHTCKQSRVHACMHACMQHAYIHTPYMHVCRHACMDARTCTRTHTYIHTGTVSTVGNQNSQTLDQGCLSLTMK